MSILTTDDAAGVRLLRLNRPEKKNAMNVALASALWEALEVAAKDDAVKVIVVGGHGDSFCAGADVALFLEAGRHAQGGGGDIWRVAKLYEPLRACKKPLIAAVHGRAVGMGVTILPHFDFVYAAPGATFTTPFVRLGLVVEYGGSFTLPRIIGRQRANELMLRGLPVGAEEMERWGLVTRVIREEPFLDAVLAIATDLASLPPGAMADCKRLVLDGEVATAFDATVERENAVLATRYGSPENVAAVQAFLSRPKR